MLSAHDEQVWQQGAKCEDINQEPAQTFAVLSRFLVDVWIC